MAGFYHKDKDRVIFTGDGELIYYIPEKYFESSIATIIGDIVECMGMFMYSCYSASGKLIKSSIFKCPTVFRCKPSSITKESSLLIKGTKEEKPYRLLHFKKGDELICNVNIPKDSSNVEKFMKLLVRGNLLDAIPYDTIHEYILSNAEMNGTGYAVSAQIIGILISELYRCPSNLSKPFRLSNTNDMLDYKAIPITSVPKYTSAYTAITSENADESVAAAITMAGKIESPLEKVMMD